MELVENLAGFGKVHARRLDALGDMHYDLIINATAAGIAHEAPAIDTPVEGSTCYDLMYGPEPTPFTLDTAFCPRTQTFANC